MVSIGVRHEGILRRNDPEFKESPGQANASKEVIRTSDRQRGNDFSPEPMGMSPEPWCPDYDSDYIDEDELIAVVGSKAPFVIKLDEVKEREEIESSSLNHMVITLTRLKLEDTKVQSDEKIEKVVIRIPPPVEYDPKAVP